MTATLEGPPPPPPAPEPAPGRADDPAPDAPASPGTGPVAEAALLLVTLVATASFARLFVDGAAVVPLLVAATTAHVVAAATRRRGFGPAATVATLLAGFALQASVTLYPHVSVLGLPTGTTLGDASRDLERAWQLYGEVTAPAPSSRGFLLASTFALWASAGLADWAAFRVRATAEAVVPALALLTFTSILAESTEGVVLAAAMVAAVLAFAVAQRVTRGAGAWVGRQGGGGSPALVRVGLATAVLCAVLAAVVGPRLPGSGGEALVDLTAGEGPTSRMTVSPLVDIRSRLVQQSDEVAFTVESERPAYWRLTSLDRFDGEVWSSSGRFSEADGRLPSEPPAATTVPVEQTYAIEALDTIWAPAALTPVELEQADSELRWNGDLATLIVPASRESIDGVSYTVTSEVPELTPGDLQAPRPTELDDALADATRLPDDVPPVVAAQARQVVSPVAPRPYDQALALQDWFRSTFTYDLQGTEAGHDESAVEAFLRARRGYCEQFAGTFAAMARSLGIPARVAVGFTPGEVDADGTTYTVRGRNAHAWPEVHIPGAGWVPFEPTPGRGQPGAEAYTGVAPAQDSADPTVTPTTTTAPPATTEPAPTTPRQDAQDLQVGSAPEPTPPTDGGGPPSLPVVAAAVALVALLLVALDVAVVALVRSRRRRRGREATTVPGRVRAAWAEAVDALARAGMGPRPAETAREYAARAATGLGDDGAALTGLAGLATTATWAPEGSHRDPRLATEASALAARVEARARAGMDRAQRVRALVDPRPLLAARRGRAPGSS